MGFSVTILPTTNPPRRVPFERPLLESGPRTEEQPFLTDTSEKVIGSIEPISSPQVPSAEHWRSLNFDLDLAGLDDRVVARRARRPRSNFPHPRKNSSHARLVHSWCIRHGLRALGDLQAAEQLNALPAAAVLASWLVGEALARGGHHFVPNSQRRRSFRGATYAELERLAWDAATWLVENYDRRRLDAAVAGGRKGGQKSKRKPSWTDADLDQLAQLDGMSQNEKSQALGVSVSTLYRMGRALAARSAPEAPEAAQSDWERLLSGEPMAWPNPARSRPDTPRDSARTRQLEAVSRRFEDADRRKQQVRELARKNRIREQEQAAFWEAIRNARGPVLDPDIEALLPEEVLA